MLKIASWTALFYGLLLLLCCAVHADNAIGVRGPVGCGENPKQVERLEITEPGVYENFLVDSDVLPERVDPGSGSRLRDTGDLSAGGLAVRRASDRGFARRRRGMALCQTASDGDQVLHRKVVRIVLEKLKAAGIALDGLTVDNPYEYLIGEFRSVKIADPKTVDWLGRVRSYEDFARERGLKFNLIVNSQRGGNTSDELFFRETLQMTDAYLGWQSRNTDGEGTSVFGLAIRAKGI